MSFAALVQVLTLDTNTLLGRLVRGTRPSPSPSQRAGSLTRFMKKPRFTPGVFVNIEGKCYNFLI